MSKLSEKSIKQQLQQCLLPYLNIDPITIKAIQTIAIEGSRVQLELLLGFPIKGCEEVIIQAISESLLTLPDIDAVDVTLYWKLRSHVVQPTVKGIPNIKNIIAIASGKGGVGKSTTAVNLALALQQQGAQVGILDADIYGPNQPAMLGAQQKPKVQDNKKLKPVLCHGLQTMSIGYLVDVKTPMVWRGPMVSSALQQLLRETLWGDLDYLLIDLPPGTGDIQLTLSQKVPVSAAVIVTTPQDVALLDARKGLEMFRKVSVPVLGIVENMSMHVCSQCGHREALFGDGGGEQLAADCDLPLLGQLPLDIVIRQSGDKGCPIVIADPKSSIAQAYHEAARRLAAKLSLQDINYAVKFPEVIIE